MCKIFFIISSKSKLCLANLKSENISNWPTVKTSILENIKINMVIQINGKTRDVLNIRKNMSEAEVEKLTRNSEKAYKHLKDKKIVKTIFVKNKIINYIVGN